VSDPTGGHAVVELLKAEGVRHVFGIVGATFLDVLDALYDDRRVEYVNVRHEQAAAFMADGLARVTDRPGVCLVTSGPGATNLLTGVAAAHVAHSPVVALVGGVSQEHQGRDAFQEFDLVAMFRPVTKAAIQVPTSSPPRCRRCRRFPRPPTGRRIPWSLPRTPSARRRSGCDGPSARCCWPAAA
jgi:acetolactate synthase-1/2/3 large subunit